MPASGFKTTNMDDYKTIIRIEGRSIDDIMRLPCVKSCEKTSIDGIVRYRFYPLCLAHPFEYADAETGDVLTEDREGKWHIFRNNKELYV